MNLVFSSFVTILVSGMNFLEPFAEGGIVSGFDLNLAGKITSDAISSFELLVARTE